MITLYERNLFFIDPVTISEDPGDLWLLLSDISTNDGGLETAMLRCGAANYDPSLEIVWIKDGYYLGNDVPARGGMSLQINYELAETLPVGQQFTMAQLQGYYKCQVWGYDPMEPVQSLPALVTFYGECPQKFRSYLYIR